MSTTTNLALNEPTYNSTSPTWDQPLNYNATILDQMYGNTTGVSVSTSGSTTYTNITAPSSTAAGSTSQAMRFNLTGALAANQNVLLPQGVAGMWIVTNSTSGTYTVTMGSNNGSNAAAGTTVSVPQGYSTIIYCDGTNVKKADDGLISSGIVSSFSAGSTGLTPSTASTGAVTLAGTLAATNGGTGLTSLGTGVQTALGNSTNAANGLVALNGSNQLPAVSGALLTNLPASGVGIGQTWTNVTSSRSLGSTYTNSTGNPIMVIVTFSGALYGSTLTIGGNTISSFNSGSSGYQFPVTFIVPNSVTYSLSGGSVGSWWELR